MVTPENQLETFTQGNLSQPTGLDTDSFENYTGTESSLLSELLSTHSSSTSSGCSIFGFWVIYSLIMVAMQASGIIGNILSFVIMWRDRYKIGTSLLLMILAVIDSVILVLMFLIASVPALCSSVSDCSYYMTLHSSYVMYYAAPLFTTFHLSTTLITLQVTSHRFVLVCIPHRSAALGSIRVVRIQALVSLLTAVIFTLPRYFEQQIIYPNGGDVPKRTKTSMGASHIYSLYYSVIAYYIVFYVIPLSILLILTVRLHRAILSAKVKRMEMTRNVATGSAANATTSAASKTTKSDDVTVTLVAVVIVFMVCQLPNPIRRTLDALLPSTQKTCRTPYFYVHRLVHFSLSLNSAINFVLYCVFGRRFRRRLVALFCKGKVEPENGSNASTVKVAATWALASARSA